MPGWRHLFSLGVGHGEPHPANRAVELAMDFDDLVGVRLSGDGPCQEPHPPYACGEDGRADRDGHEYLKDRLH